MESEEEPASRDLWSSAPFADLVSLRSNFRLTEFCQKLIQVYPVFEKLQAVTACLTLLSCDRIARQIEMRGESKALEVEVPKAACTQLLKFLLDSLPHCGQSYLGVFKAIVDFSQGNTFLPITDKVFLLEQLKSSNLESEVACLKEESSDGTSKPKQLVSPPAPKEAKTDSETVKEFFDRISSATLRHPSSASPKSTTSKDEKETSQKEDFSQMCVEVLEELGAEKILLDFCLNIPVLKMTEKVEYLKASLSGDEGVATLIKRLQEVSHAVESVCLLLQLPTLSNITSRQTVALLTQLLVSCLQVCTAVCVAVSGTGKGSKTMTQSGASEAEVAAPPSQEATPTPPVDSISDLYSHLSICTRPLPAVKPLVSVIINSVLKAHLKLFSLLRMQPKVNTDLNMNTLIVYHILYGLQPLLGQTGSGEGTGKVVGHAKLSVPVGELLLCAVECLQVLCEDVANGEDESGKAALTILTFDLYGSYSGWQRVEMLLSHLPLLNMLPAAVLAAYKKALSLSERSNGHSKKDQESLIKTRTDKQEHLAHRLRLSLSEKISEKLPTLEPHQDDDEEELYSPSSNSTVSSSGDVGGVYTLHSSGQEDSEPSTSDDNEIPSLPLDDDMPHPLLPPPEHPLFPFMAAFLRRADPSTPIAPPPPPPPLPPRLPPRNIPRAQKRWPDDESPPHGEILKKKPTFYFRLASFILSTVSNSLFCNQHKSVTEFVLQKIHAEHISCFAWLLRTATDTHFQSILLEMLHSLITRGLINEGHQGLLLRELELNARCWPLRVSPACLSVLGRVLVYRGGLEYASGDPLAINIWKGFLRSLEEACVSGEESDEDFDVVYLQLMLLVWHNFPSDVRADLLRQCAHAVIKIARAKERGDAVSSLMTSRLLMILDYLLFQFSEPVPQLIEQVNHNLFSSYHRDNSSPGHTPKDVKYYLNELQLQYATVISKPKAHFKPGGRDVAVEAGIDPKFYSVRLVGVASDQEGAESTCTQAVDEEACTTILTMAPPEGVSSPYPQDSDNKGYNLLCHALISLMECGMDYDKRQLKLCDRVLCACASHQCFTLCLGMLNQLPPSLPVLRTVVDWSDLSCTESYGSCLLIHILLLRFKLKAQFIDTEDVSETLCLTGYSQEVTEELFGKVISVIYSTEIFISQSVALFEKLLESKETSMLPLICLIALNLFVCFVNREVRFLTEPTDPTDPPAPDSKERFPGLLPALLKVVCRLLQCGHVFVLSPSSQVFSPQFNNGDLAALEMMLSVSVKDVKAKGTVGRALFGCNFPKSISERLSDFSAAILIDGPIKNDLLTCKKDGLRGSRCMERYLDLHFRAFAGTQTFSPVRAIKTTIHSCISLLNEPTLHFQDFSKGYVNELVSLSCDCLMDHTFQDELATIVDLVPDFFNECVKYKLTECLRVVRDEQVLGSSYFGVVLAELFVIMSGLVDNAVLVHLFTGENLRILSDLVLLCTKPYSNTAVLQCITFLTKVLKEADNTPDAPHLVAVVEQISNLSSLSPNELQEWMTAVFLTKDSLSTEDYFNIGFCKEFFYFVECLKSPNCKVDPALCNHLLTALLPLGPEIIKRLSDKHQPRLSSAFDFFFDSLILLAGSNVECGHLVLVKAVESWLPNCTEFLTDWEKDESNMDDKFEGLLPPDRTSPVGCLFLYLSQLTSAVLFSTKILKVTDKRNLAGEVDNLVADSEPDSDEEGEGSGDIEEDSLGEDSEDEELNNKLCTFTQTHREFANQHWYCCHTCRLVEGQGVCSVCAKVCHKGHDLTYTKYGSFFCDCGAKEDGSCEALVKREGVTGEGSPLSPHERALFSNLEEKRKKKEGKTSKRRSKKESKVAKPRREKSRRVPRRTSFPSLPVLKMARQIENYKAELRDYLDSSSLTASTLKLLLAVLPPVVSSIDQASSFGCSPARQAMVDLHQVNKDVEYSDTLMAATLGSQEGAFENVRLNFTGDQGQTIRQLIGGHSIKREAMCTLLSQNGKRQHLCVNHDKGKLTVLQLFPILKQADSNRRKLTLTRLSTTSVPFTVLSMSHSPSKEDHIAVCGLKDAQLLTLNSAGQVTKRDSMHPSVGANGYIVKTMWMPGHHSELLLVSDTFVKIYNAKVDVVSPSFYFELPMGKIRDATIAITDEDKFVVIMTSLGKIYYQPIIHDLSAQDGPIYFTMDLPVNHSNVVESDNQINGGGASVYYSHTLRLLFFSYFNGRSFMMAPQSSFSGYTTLCELPLKSNPVTPGSKGGGPALVQWTEVQHHPGLVCALTQTSSNPVVILVKPDKVQIQELKALPNKAKVQGMVAMRQPAAPGDPTSQSRTTLMTLCEDGSLRIYVTNKNTNTEFWLQHNFQPVSPLAVIKSRMKERSLTVTRRTGTPKFPIDFFENCQQLQPNEFEFQGSDILHIYNKQQVKTRLNAGTLYLANNKPSGFTIEVNNHHSGTVVMVGIRILIGFHSVEKAPSFVEVFGRTHTVCFPAGTSRWMDMPFTRDEALQADKELKINFGPSMDPSGVSFIDCIKVYTRSKTAFGWPEDPPVSTLSPSKRGSGQVSGSQGAESEEEGSDLSQLVSSRKVTPVDRLVCDAFDVLSNHCLSVDQDKIPDVSEVISKATNLLTYSVPFQLQYHFKYLLASTVTSREVYLEKKDHIQLSHVVQSLTDCQTKDKLMEPEYFQYLLLLLLKIGKVRPDNLAVLAMQVGQTLRQATKQDGGETGDKEKCSLVALFVDLLVKVFWRLFMKNPTSPAVRPVVNPGFTLVYVTVACMTEVMWLFVVQDHTLLSTVLEHSLKFLFYPDSQVCVPTSRVIMKLLKDRKMKRERRQDETPPTAGTTDKTPPTSPQTEQELMEHLAGVATPIVLSESEDATDNVDGEGVPGGAGEGAPGEGAASGEDDEPDDEGDQDEHHEDDGWQHLPEQPSLSLEAALGANHAEMMEQILANPEQYMVAVNDLIPDEDAMMNLAIQLSLQSEGGGGGGMLGEAARPILAAMGLQLPPPANLSSHPPESAPENNVEQPPDSNQQAGVSHDQLVPRTPPPAPGGHESGRSSSSSLASLSRVPMDQSPLLLRGWERVLNEDAQSNVHREGVEGDPGVRGEDCEDATNEKRQDMNSEPEMANDSSGEDESGEDDDTIAEKVTEMLDSPTVEKVADNTEDKLSTLRRLLISKLLVHLNQAEDVGGLRSISYLQLLMFLTMNLDCTRDDSNLLITVLYTFTSRLDLSSQEVFKMIHRDPAHETRLLYLRFLNILMSRKKSHGKEEKSAYASHMLFYTTARTLLSETQLLTFCRRLLSEITARPQCLHVAEDTPAVRSISQTPFTHPLEDMSPFFQKQYIKANSTDIFAAYGRLLAEILLVLPCQLKKTSEASKHIPSPEFGSDWISTLCDFLLKVSQTTGVGRKHVRKLLLHICGSKDNYRLTRDVHALRSHMTEVVVTCRTSGFNPESYTGLPVHMAYTSMLKVIEQLRACEEIATTRTSNWQAFCQMEKNTLLYLFHASFVLDEGIVPLILRLLHAALSGLPPVKTSNSHSTGGGLSEGGILRRAAKKEKEVAKAGKESKQIEPNKEVCAALVQTFMSFMDDNSLTKFITLYLLQTNCTSLRWQAHRLLHTLYEYSQTPEQVGLVESLWRLWPQMPSYGRKAAQFVDLLGYLSISTPQVLDKESLCETYVERAIDLLKKQNNLVSTHPNFHIYSQLQNLVDFDGFYLENEPCLVCNDPEIPYGVLKLQSIKSEIKYSPKMILVKLVGSYNISQLILRISDIKRTKMVRTVNVYYSNRTVQNVIELKNKRKMWMTARSCSLTAGQSEVKIDFPLPIVASNLVIEFRDFYDNLQAGSEILQCPRCQATVSAHPGVCGTCGENVYQCHKCRAINYDEKDPFLCNSCGFSKYAKFDVYVESKPSSAVDPIETEEDRQKTASSINTMLERADYVYKILVQHRNDLDQLLGSLAGGIIVSPGAGLSTDTGANKGILLVAQRYSIDCKSTYQELSKIIQSVLASRRELVSYDQRIMEFGTGMVPEDTEGTGSEGESARPQTQLETIPPIVLSTATPIGPASTSPTPHTHHQGWCFGCSSAAIEHCITLLKALAFVSPTRHLLVKQNLIRELVGTNLTSGSLQTRIYVRRLLCQLTRDDAEATAELNRYILERVLDQISPKHVTPNLASSVRPEIMLLAASLDMEDSCWEERLRTVVRLFQRSQCNSSPAVIAGVTLPCLKILQNVIYPKEAVGTKDKKKSFIDECSSLQLGDDITVKASDWLKGDKSACYETWRSNVTEKPSKLETMSKEEVHRYKLMEKYAKIWRRKTVKVTHSRSLLRNDSWLRSMLFNPSSQSARKASCNLVESLCQGEARHRQILDLLCSFLDQVGKAGECAQEYLELLHMLTADSTGKWKTYLAMRGVLPQIGNLISMEIDHISQLEDTTMGFNLSQGYALKMLTVLLQAFLQVDTIKQHFKGKLVGVVLNGYLSLKRLVVQRTKRIDESQELLLQMLEDLTSGTDQERQEFMATCVETLNRFRDSDMVTPIFVFERLCNIIHPEENDVGDFYLSLDKDPQQEEFLQGRMQGNPYPSTTAGLGPLMRDVKNKICTDCELVALLEDDTGMELLVSNKIISLDLPVKDVYRKIWCSQPNRGECMRVVYRMRGLLGDATEDMVEQLDDGKDKDVNEEEVYKTAAILSKCGGLDAVLSRLARVKDFIQGHNLISAALKLLGFCVKLKENRQYLLQPHLNTLNTLLGTLDLALHYEERNSTGIGAAVAEKTLKVTERFLQEASSEAPVLVRTTSQETDGGELSPLPDDDDRLQVFLKHIESTFVQSNPSIRESLMHIIPFLTFGDPRHMNVLLQHFEPYLDFDKFDLQQSAENTLYLDCFCVVASGIGKDASGEKLKDLAKETGLTPSAVAYLKKKVPHKIGSFDTPEWKSCISQPSLPYVLKMLTGLSHWHTKTQEALMDAIPELHLLEQVASEQHIGTLAENLLEAMAQHPPCFAEIKKVRKATREEKKKKAMAMRKKELGALGMQVNEKGQVIAKSGLLSAMETQLIEESGLKCCICLEGYKNQPQKILGIYTYTRKIALDEFENKPRKTLGYTTVSHFNVVHYDCHSAAVKLARSRDEWESATLQNANTKCNGLLPIWGTEITATNFASSVARFHNFLQECTGLFDPSFHTLAHDMRLLLLRFAYEKSFSAESGGGGPQSNMFLLPFFIHVGAYVMNSSHCFQREERNLSNFLSTAADKWVSSSYELDGPLYCVVISLFVQSLAQWEENRVMFLKRLLLLAHTRNASSSLIKSLSSSTLAEFSVYKPVLMLFALVDCLQKMLKGSLKTGLVGSAIPEALLEYIRANDSVVLDGCDKLLTKYQEEMQPCESLEEFCDVMGLLGAVENPGVFITELISSATAGSSNA